MNHNIHHQHFYAYPNHELIHFTNHQYMYHPKHIWASQSPILVLFTNRLHTTQDLFARSHSPIFVHAWNCPNKHHHSAFSQHHVHIFSR
jgi:hypothetical protein